MCTRSPCIHGRAPIVLAIVFFWWIRYCRGTPIPNYACNVIADGRELLCRGANLSSVRPIYDVDLLRVIVPDNVTKIDLTNNNITDIPIRAFHRFSNLEILFLRRNHLQAIHDDAFVNLATLRILELGVNYLTSIPAAAVNLPSLEELSISNNKIEQLPENALHHASNLVSLDLHENPIKEIHDKTFRNLRKLRKLILSNIKELRIFPNLNGVVSLEILRLDHSQLREVPSNLCQQCPKLKSLDLKSNYLKEIPNLRNCHELRILDLASNMISVLPDDAFNGLNMLHDLLLSNNNLQTISSDAFTGLPRLQVLDLEQNYIKYIHPDAFRETKQLEDLNLGNNIFPTMPIRGLAGLLHLKTFNNPALREFPSPERFPRVQTMLLSYAYHCCSFLSVEMEESVTKSPVRESILFPTDNEFDSSLWNSTFSDIWPQLDNLTDKFGTQINEFWANFGSDFTYPGNLPTYLEDYFEELESRTTPTTRTMSSHIQCMPQPGTS